MVAYSFCVWSQDGQKERADKAYSKTAYIDAAKRYQSLIDQGYESADLYGKLGDTYYLNSKYKEALTNYEKMFRLSTAVAVEYLFRYSQCLRISGDEKKADKYLNKFFKSIGVDHQSAERLAGEIKTLPGQKYNLDDVGINSKHADFGAAFYGDDQVIFTSARDTGLFVTRIDKWSGMPFLKLYSAHINPDGTLGEAEKLKGKVNSRFHQSTAAVTQDGKTIYFTRNNFNNGKFGRGKDGFNHLKIYRATLVGSKWKNVEELSINSDDYSTAHPALSPDGKYLYFVSNRPGVIGDSDIFRVPIKRDGDLGEVENLGPEINTPAKESFPFVDQGGNLYFSSNGHRGFGGLDVFVVTKDSFGKNRIVNLNHPINSAYDDFGFVMRNDGIGFLSSNRDQANGFDNIYSVQGDKIETFATLKGQILDSVSTLPIGRLDIELSDDTNEVVATLQTDVNGGFEIEVWPLDSYKLKILTEGYEQQELSISPLADQKTKAITLNLVKDTFELKQGDELTKQLKLNPIYFEFDGFVVQKVSEKELAKVITLLKKYPRLNIEVHSHTDSRGSSEYNQWLSDKRAQATVAFMVIKGAINKDRVQGKGHGESMPLIDCETEDCGVEEHRLNRRSEFRIVTKNRFFFNDSIPKLK